MFTYSDKSNNCSIECKSTKTYNNVQHPFKLDKTDIDIKKATPYVYNEGDFIEGNGFVLHNAYKDLGKVDLRRRRRVVEEKMGYERRHTLCYFYKEGNARKGVKCNNDKSRQGKVTELDVVAERNEGEMKTVQYDEGDEERKRKGVVMESKCVQTCLNGKKRIFKKKKIGKIKDNEKDWGCKGKEKDWKGGHKRGGDNDNENWMDESERKNIYKVNDDDNNSTDGDNNNSNVNVSEKEDFVSCLYKQIRKSKHKKIHLNCINNNNNNIDIDNHHDNNNANVNKPKPKRNLNIITQLTANNLPIPKSFLNRPFTNLSKTNPSNISLTSPSPSPVTKTPPYRSLLEHFNQNRSHHHPPFPAKPPQLIITSYTSKPSNPSSHPFKKTNFDNIKLLSQTEHHRTQPLQNEPSSSSSRRHYILDEAEINGMKAPIDVYDLKTKFHNNNNNNDITRNKTCLADITKLVTDKATFHSNNNNVITPLLTPKKVVTKHQIANYISQPSTTKYKWYIVDSIIYPINNMHETALRIDNKHLYN